MMENSTADTSYMDRNVSRVRERIVSAAKQAGRDPSDVTLLAAVKYADTAEVNYLHDVLGIRDVGENRVQQLLDRWDTLHREDLRVHFIGTLQTNKVKYIIDKVCMIHSLDSLKLAAEIDRQAKKHGICMDVLCEINSGHEASKSGVAPEDAAQFCQSLAAYPNLRLCGFMTMAPKCEKNEEFCKYFSETSALALDIWQKKLDNIDKPVLSMGMSESFEPAILSGATMVRVGRRLFASPEQDVKTV